jgi:hypothetical protein
VRSARQESAQAAAAFEELAPAARSAGPAAVFAPEESARQAERFAGSAAAVVGCQAAGLQAVVWTVEGILRMSRD